jgi:plastocyanin
MASVLITMTALAVYRYVKNGNSSQSNRSKHSAPDPEAQLIAKAFPPDLQQQILSDFEGCVKMFCANRKERLHRMRCQWEMRKAAEEASDTLKEGSNTKKDESLSGEENGQRTMLRDQDRSQTPSATSPNSNHVNNQHITPPQLSQTPSPVLMEESVRPEPPTNGNPTRSMSPYPFPKRTSSILPANSTTTTTAHSTFQKDLPDVPTFSDSERPSTPTTIRAAITSRFNQFINSHRIAPGTPSASLSRSSTPDSTSETPSNTATQSKHQLMEQKLTYDPATCYLEAGKTLLVLWAIVDILKKATAAAESEPAQDGNDEDEKKVESINGQHDIVEADVNGQIGPTKLNTTSATDVDNNKKELPLPPLSPRSDTSSPTLVSPHPSQSSSPSPSPEPDIDMKYLTPQEREQHLIKHLSTQTLVSLLQMIQVLESVLRDKFISVQREKGKKNAFGSGDGDGDGGGGGGGGGDAVAGVLVMDDLMSQTSPANSESPALKSPHSPIPSPSIIDSTTTITSATTTTTFEDLNITQRPFTSLVSQYDSYILHKLSLGWGMVGMIIDGMTREEVGEMVMEHRMFWDVEREGFLVARILEELEGRRGTKGDKGKEGEIQVEELEVREKDGGEEGEEIEWLEVARM